MSEEHIPAVVCPRRLECLAPAAHSLPPRLGQTSTVLRFPIGETTPPRCRGGRCGNARRGNDACTGRDTCHSSGYVSRRGAR